jgi:hypothetical protein
MFSSFWRRPTVALIAILAVLLPISLIGIQSTASASNAQPVKLMYYSQTHNPTCRSAFGGQKLCITASPTGLTFKWTGYTFNIKPGCKVGCLWSEGIDINGPDISFSKTYLVEWAGATYTKFVPLKRPDDYYGSASIANPCCFGAVAVSYRLIVPQVGNSNLAIRTTSPTLPGGKLGQRYLFRFYASGGKPPYRWIRIVSRTSNLPKGLVFYTTGPKAGTITGIPRQTGWFNVPVIVRDKVGHSAYMYLSWLTITS